MTLLWTLLTQNPIARAIAWAVMGALAILTFGKINHRKGVKAERARQDAADAKAREKTVKEVLNETVSDDPADDIRRRMRERAGRQP